MTERTARTRQERRDAARLGSRRTTFDLARSLVAPSIEKMDPSTEVLSEDDAHRLVTIGYCLANAWRGAEVAGILPADAKRPKSFDRFVGLRGGMSTVDSLWWRQTIQRSTGDHFAEVVPELLDTIDALTSDHSGLTLEQQEVLAGPLADFLQGRRIRSRSAA